MNTNNMFPNHITLDKPLVQPLTEVFNKAYMS